MLNQLRRASLFGLAYFASYLLNFALGFDREAVACAFWIPNGVILAVLIRCPPREWPSYLVATLIAKQAGGLAEGGTWWGVPDLVVGVSNFAEATIGALAIRALGFRWSPTFDRLSGVLTFVGVAVVAAPILPTAIDAAVQPEAQTAFWTLWRTFYVGDSLGILIATPLVLAWWPDPDLPLRPRPLEVAEATLLAVSLAAVTFAIFSPPAPHPVFSPYLAAPSLVWAATRLGRRGATAAVAEFAVLSVLLASPGYGALSHAGETINERVASLQRLLAVASISTLALSALLRQRERFAEERLRAAGLEAMGRLAAGIAHDFNNDLTVISGWTELLEAEEVDEERRNGFAQITRSVERAQHLTSRLLAFSRREERRAELNEVEVLLRPMRPSLERILEHRIRLELDVAANLPPLRIDARELEVALINLVMNARDAMPSGGELRIDASHARMPAPKRRGRRSAEPPPGVRIRIIDQGEGIEPGQLRRIFDPFYTSKPVGEGTGLGLATVKRVVEENGGVVDVHSGPDGTTFSLYFPIADEPR